jgi:hypothetical protein
MKHFHLEVDFSFSVPDFVITNHGGINVEATVASHAQGSTPESVQSGAPIPNDLNEFNRQTIIRISNSFDAKRRKYIGSYAGLPHVPDRPFVLAISAFDRPFAMLTCQRAIEAVLFGYYVDEERFLREGSALEGKRIESVTKDNKSPVPVGIEEQWCGRWESNPHEEKSPEDFHAVYGFRRPDGALLSVHVRFAVWTIPSPSPGISGA